jgi:hypothetical protein
MGNAHSSLLGRVLREVEIFHDSLHAVASGDASSLSSSWESHWDIEDFPDFRCWKEDFSHDPLVLFRFLLEEVVAAKRKWGLPMSLFPADSPGALLIGTNPPLEQRTEWAEAPSNVLDAQRFMQCVQEEKEAKAITSSSSSETYYCTARVSVTAASHAGWRVDVAPIEVDGKLSDNTSSVQQPVAAACRPFVCELMPLQAEWWRDLCVGDHITYVDRETSRYAMEHHLVVVDVEPIDAVGGRPQVLCVGVMMRSRWMFASLTLFDLYKMLGNMKEPPTLYRVVVSGLQQPTRYDARSAALACVGLHGVWFGSTMNCEDWANWISTGWIFSLQRMRAISAAALDATSLIIETEEGRINDEKFERKDILAHCSDPQEFVSSCPVLRRLRLAAFEALETHENFN